MSSWEHATAVLKMKEAFSYTRKDSLPGLDEDSSTVLTKMGKDGWVLVSVLPWNPVGTKTEPGTGKVIAFFKRPILT